MAIASCLRSLHLSLFNLSVRLDVRQFEAEMLFAVHDLKIKAKNECGHAKACKHHKRPSVIVAYGSLLRGHRAVLHSRHDVGIGRIENLADTEREQPQADVLNLENQRICRTDDFCVYKFGDARP